MGRRPGAGSGEWRVAGLVAVAMGAVGFLTALGGPMESLGASPLQPPGRVGSVPAGSSGPSIQEVGPTADDPEALFREGNRLYQQNDFTGARNAYQAVLRSGYESADLYYNLGNAHFKAGDLGRAILSYERALRLDPRNPDAQANLELARSLTADDVEPMPRFWILSALDWWVDLLPGSGLVVLVALAWLAVAGGLCIRILGRRPGSRPPGSWLVAGGGVGLLVFGLTFLARTGTLGGTEWGIILEPEVAVQSAPSWEDDLTLFHVHEGTKVRLDQRADAWSEVVLEDGRVGWVPTGSLEEI